jgi:hypothetical protein
LTTIDPIRSLLSEAGLDLIQLTLSSLSLTELIARAEARQSLDRSGASLVVVRDGARMELAVVCQRQLIAAHAVKWSSVNDIPPVAKMLAEVSRVLVQVQAWLPEGTLQRAWIIGDDIDVGELPDAVSQRWNCTVQRFDPWRDCNLSLGSTTLEGSPSEYAIAAGLALIQSGELTPKLDLLHPRQPPPKRDHRKPYIAAAAAAGLLIVAFGTAIVQLSLSSYDRAIEKKRTEDDELTRWIAARKPVETASKSIEEWQSRNINQLDQFVELYQMMNGTRRIVINDYQFNTAAGNAIARLKLVGKARERKEIEKLAEHLDELPKFKVPPTSEQKSGDAEYPSRFGLDMELVQVKKKPTTSNAPQSNVVNAGTNKK